MDMNSIKIPWVDKYKPNNLDDILLDSRIKDIIKFFNKDTISHIILYGDSGIGKTTLSHIIPKYLNIRYKEYNASDTRGINTIQEILILYKQTNSKLIIILDEADNLTLKAQELLINIMDNYHDIIFIFTCNTYQYLINSIMNRCLFFNLVYKDMNTFLNYFKKIIKIEKLNIIENDLKYIIDDLNFDMRMIMSKLELLKIIYKDEIIDENKINSYNTLSSIKECIDILNILFDKNTSLDEFISFYEENNENGLNFIDFININLFIFNNYHLFKKNIKKKFSQKNIIDFLSLLHKYNIKLLNIYIYTELQYYNILIDLYNFSRNENKFIS